MPFALAVIITFLSGFTDIRLAEIQLVEVAVICALFMAFMSPRQTLSLQGPSIIVGLMPQFLWLFLLVLCGCILSMRLNFYPPSGISLIKHPPFLTFVRFIEVVISSSSMFLVALAVRNEPQKLKTLFTAFMWAAYLNCAYAIISWLGWAAGFGLPGITPGLFVPRLRGFFAEGGPLGVFLCAAFLIQLIRGVYLHYISRRSYWIGMAVVLIGLIGAQSKAAVLTLFTLLVIFSIKQRRLVIIFACAALVVPLAIASNFVDGMSGYASNLSNFDSAAAERPTDGNLVNGRLMASILLPRIIEEHPILGVGLGNYSLVRNDPQLLQGLPRTELWDLHGLGLLGYAAELGIPLTLFAMWLYAYPAARALRARPWLLLLSCYPVLAAVFGVQLNFAYPWIVAGMALAALSIDQEYQARVRASAAAAEPAAIPPLDLGGRAISRQR